MLPKNRRPTHPGEILRYEFLEPLNMTQQQLADAIGVTRVRINELIARKIFQKNKICSLSPPNVPAAHRIRVNLGSILQPYCHLERSAAESKGLI